MRFSIIIPVYNAEKYVDACLNSVLRQDYQDFEILLIDDGSQDGSGAICKAYAQRHSNVHYVYQENSGPSSARNKGIQLSEGEYLLFLDSDDAIESGSLRRINDILSEKKPDAIISALKICFVERNTISIEGAALDCGKINGGKEDALQELADKRFSTPASKVVIKRQIVVENGLMFPTEYVIGEDIFMMAQSLCKCNSLFYNTEPYYIYNQHGSSITHTVDYGRISKTMLICEELYKRSADMQQGEQRFLYTQMSMMLINFVQHFGSFSADQKRELLLWMRKRKDILNAIVPTHKATGLISTFLGAKNAFLLAGFVVSRNKTGQ